MNTVALSVILLVILVSLLVILVTLKVLRGGLCCTTNKNSMPSAQYPPVESYRIRSKRSRSRLGDAYTGHSLCSVM